MHELDGRPIGAAIGHRVEQLVGHLGDRGLQPGDAPGGEGAGNQAPDPRVARRGAFRFKSQSAAWRNTGFARQVGRSFSNID